MGRQLMRKDPDLTIKEARQASPFRPAFMSVWPTVSKSLVCRARER